MLKKEMRVLGIDDAAFDKFKKGRVYVIGTLFRGGLWMDGCMSTKIRVDGDDATDKISEMILKSKFRPQIQAIILDGIAVGGFNVIDTEKLNRDTGIPVIVVMRHYPKKGEMISALESLGMREKAGLIRKAGKIHKAGKIYFQVVGESREWALEVLRITCTHSFIPEPVRVAHLIAQAISLGESRGKA